MNNKLIFLSLKNIHIQGTFRWDRDVSKYDITVFDVGPHFTSKIIQINTKKAII